MKYLYVSVCLACFAGCSAFYPGYDTKTAMNQRFHFGWDQGNNFISDGDGTQTGSFVMAEGAIVLKPDKTVDPEKSKITTYLSYEPKADAVRDAYAIALANSTMQQQMMHETLMGLLNRFVPGGGSAGNGATAAAPAGTGGDRLERILGLVEKALATRPAPGK